MPLLKEINVDDIFLTPTRYAEQWPFIDGWRADILENDAKECFLSIHSKEGAHYYETNPLLVHFFDASVECIGKNGYTAEDHARESLELALASVPLGLS